MADAPLRSAGRVLHSQAGNSDRLIVYFIRGRSLPATDDSPDLIRKGKHRLVRAKPWDASPARLPK